MSRKKTSRRNANPKLNPILLWGGVAVLVVVLAGVLFFRPDRAPAVPALPLEVSVAEAASLRDAGAFILDVRQPEEWNESHIPGATLIPLPELETRVNEVPKGQKIVVVCRSGNRSAQGRDILLSAGFTEVTSMAGGINQWKAAGLATQSGP
jgi:rhodanese-related sulfurtransferase